MILLSDYLFYVIIVKRSVEKARGQHAMHHIQIVGGTYKIRPFGTKVLLFSSGPITKKDTAFLISVVPAITVS